MLHLARGGGPRAGLLFAFAVLAGAAAGLRGVSAAEAAATERWYEILDRNGKLGHQRVVWSASTWEGKPTVHDTTTVHTTSVREMVGMKDTFDRTSVSDLERAEDGTLWWQRTVDTESDQVRTSELRWTGKGYVQTERLGSEEERRIEIALDAPVMTDSESTLGPRARAGTLKAGDVIPLRVLDLLERGVRTHELRVVGPDPVAGEKGPVDCVRVEERDPVSGATSSIWIDADGAFVLLKTEGGTTFRRTTREKAEAEPEEPTEHTITTPASPPMERIFSAEETTVEVHLQADPDRPLPDFPDSPWSRLVEKRGNEDEGWVLRMALRRYDTPDAHATIPVTDAAFAKDLEPTVLMQTHDPRLVEAAKQAIGDATDARVAAHRLVRHVFDTLEKESPAVQQASALQILDECRGDCSEHALLFVALCRAAGIPARLCSGYVCVGSDWGAHSWAEIWTGAWIGADPTTGEIGTAARYVFYGYPDRAGSFPGLVSSRVQGRMRLVTTRVKEGDDDYAVGEDPSTWTIHDRSTGHYVHVLAGIEARDVPPVWVVRMRDDARCTVRAEGFHANLRVFADQGHTLEEFADGRTPRTFAGAPALFTDMSQVATQIIVHSRRRFIQIMVVRADEPERIAELERYFAPTFAPVPRKAKPKPVDVAPEKPHPEKPAPEKTPPEKKDAPKEPAEPVEPPR